VISRGPETTRRRRHVRWRLALATCLCVTVASAATVRAQDDSGILIQTLNAFDVLYVLSGGGANVLALIGDDGIVLIDTGDTASTPRMLETLRGVSDKPVTTIVNSHAHADHAGGNVNLPTATRVVAHENAKTAMARMPTFDGTNARFLPNETVSDRMSLLDGPDRIDLYYFGRGHTDGDLVVVFPEKGTAYLGDLFPSKGVPAVDVAAGGSMVALARTLATIVSDVQGVRTVVPGHAPPRTVQIRADRPGVAMPTTVTMSWRDLEEYAAFVADFVGAVQASRERGLSVDEALATLSLPDRYQSFDMKSARGAIEAIYAELMSR
jgi:cyclase